MDEPIKKKNVAACVRCLNPLGEDGECAQCAARERAFLEATAARRDFAHAEDEVARLELMLVKAKGDVAAAVLRCREAMQRAKDLAPPASGFVVGEWRARA